MTTLHVNIEPSMLMQIFCYIIYSVLIKLFKICSVRVTSSHAVCWNVLIILQFAFISPHYKLFDVHLISMIYSLDIISTLTLCIFMSMMMHRNRIWSVGQIGIMLIHICKLLIYDFHAHIWILIIKPDWFSSLCIVQRSMTLLWLLHYCLYTFNNEFLSINEVLDFSQTRFLFVSVAICLIPCHFRSISVFFLCFFP